jgi:hypothetical protein
MKLNAFRCSNQQGCQVSSGSASCCHHQTSYPGRLRRTTDSQRCGPTPQRTERGGFGHARDNKKFANSTPLRCACRGGNHVENPFAVLLCRAAEVRAMKEQRPIW